MVNQQHSNTECWYYDVCQEDCQRCVKYIYIKRLMRYAGIPEALHHPIYLECNPKDLNSFERLAQIKEDIDTFIEEGNNLYICGHNTGNGKTSWSLKLAYKYFSYVWNSCDIDRPQVLFIYVPEFVLALKDFNNPLSKTYLDSVKTAPLVIFDDIGTGEISNYDYTQLLVYVNARQSGKLSTIYTSNVTTLKELSDKIGDKLASRIYNTSEIVELKGKDMRK